MSLSKKTKISLLKKSLSIKKRFVDMYFKANAGHIGSSLSCTDILTSLYFNWMSADDEIILSKGHAAAALYSLLAEAGIISDKEICTFYQNNTYLAAHPPANKIKKIPFATGSLGHGLGLAAGFGLASKLKEIQKKIFCISSDGELNEGSTWEAALFIAQHNLKNVLWFIDRNKLQGFGLTEDIMKLNPLDDKLRAFGFDVLVINGHDYEELNLVKEFHNQATKPIAIICNTIKGNGWLEQENQLACHYLPFTETEYKNILNSFEKQNNWIQELETRTE
jgi:transketolase